MIGSEGEIDLPVRAEVFFLEGTQRLFERRFDEALALLSGSLDISRALNDVKMQVNALLQRAVLMGYQDRYAEMLPDLSKAQELLETQLDPDRNLLLGVFQDSALAHLELGHESEARRYLFLAKGLCEELDQTISRHQLEWTEGRLAQRCGDALMAERLMIQARDGFIAQGDRVTAALAAVDVAIVCHEQGRFREVLNLVAGDAIPVLQEVLHAEALAALKLLHEAVAAEEASVATLHKVREVLRGIQRDPARGVGPTNAPATEHPPSTDSAGQ